MQLIATTALSRTAIDSARPLGVAGTLKSLAVTANAQYQSFHHCIHVASIPIVARLSNSSPTPAKPFGALIAPFPHTNHFGCADAACLGRRTDIDQDTLPDIQATLIAWRRSLRTAQNSGIPRNIAAKWSRSLLFSTRTEF